MTGYLDRILAGITPRGPEEGKENFINPMALFIKYPAMMHTVAITVFQGVRTGKYPARRFYTSGT